MTAQTIQQQTRALGQYLTLFSYPLYRGIRTRIVDALNRTSDASYSGNYRALRAAKKRNEALLRDCRKAVETMPSGIFNEVCIAIEDRHETER